MNTGKIDWDTWKLRCHAIGNVMGAPKAKADKDAGNLSVTAKSYLLKCYIKERFGREKEIKSKYIKKGHAVEEDNITLYSRLKKKFFKKNTTRLTHNAFIVGEPDLFEGEDILNASVIIDMKSCWDIFTFYDNVIEMVEEANKAIEKAEKKAAKKKAAKGDSDEDKDDEVSFNGVNPNYYWQGMGYMALTGAKMFYLAYGLIDTPEALIDKEKWYLLNELGGYLALEGNKEKEAAYLEGCEELDRSLRFEDIPMDQRLLELPVERNEAQIDQIYKRVEKCREYLKYLDMTLTPAILASYSNPLRKVA
jgi:hypothetical protein